MQVQEIDEQVKMMTDGRFKDEKIRIMQSDPSIEHILAVKKAMSYINIDGGFIIIWSNTREELIIKVKKRTSKKNYRNKRRRTPCLSAKSK